MWNATYWYNVPYLIFCSTILSGYYYSISNQKMEKPKNHENDLNKIQTVKGQ